VVPVVVVVVVVVVEEGKEGRQQGYRLYHVIPCTGGTICTINGDYYWC